ncbi:MAG: rubredoxin [Thermoplasmata archaeon]|nr:rubredoxin [Thermoplasmata archaeon]
MEMWKCTVCGWIYDPATGVPDAGVEPETPFEDLEEDFRCPKCGAKKKLFERMVP